VRPASRFAFRRAMKIISIGLCSSVALLWLARFFYGERLRHKIWPATVASSRIAPVTARTNVLLLIGDSRIREWGEPQVPDFSVINAGMSGCTSAEVLALLPSILDQTRPTVVLVQAGINDLKFLGVRPELSVQVETLLLTNMTRIAQLCEGRGAKVIITPIWPPGEVTMLRRLVWSPQVEQSIVRINLELSRLELKNVQVIDLFTKAFRDFDEPRRLELYRDTLHLKPNAYRVLTITLRNTMGTVSEKASE
jgi:lysophospholipase L1-like esterase